MPIIAYLGKDITEYIENRKKNLDELHFYCPKHGNELTRHGEYDRKIKDFEITISIQRLKCSHKNCNYTQAILPDFLQPNKHYSAYEITCVLADAENSTTPLGIDSIASISTVRRWISEYWPILDEKISRLKAFVYQFTNKVVNEIALSSDKPMTAIHKLLTGFGLPTINRTNTLGAAFIYKNALSAPT